MLTRPDRTLPPNPCLRPGLPEESLRKQASPPPWFPAQLTYYPFTSERSLAQQSAIADTKEPNRHFAFINQAAFLRREGCMSLCKTVFRP